MKKTLLILILLTNLIGRVCSQVSTYNTLDLHPVSPTAFQFLKYSEIPVSEYTGIPNISVPLYEFKVDDIKIPVTLSYHSQGIKVSQEASWVGLGWDLTMGSIVQQINDRDDYGYDPLATNQPNIKMLPDYFPSMGDGSPTNLPMRYLLPMTGVRGSGWSNPYPINTPIAQQGYAVATDFAIPVNGEFDTKQVDLFNTRWYDSEPDIFTANFFGETVKFTTDFSNPLSPSTIVLNKKGYIVHKTTNGFSILNPAGNTFFFEIKSVIQSDAYSQNFGGMSISGSGIFEPTSNIFFLSSILTKYGKTISFQYSTTGLNQSYPSYSDKLEVLNNRVPTSTNIPYGNGAYFEYNSLLSAGITSGTNWTKVYNQENYIYLQSISWPNGQLNFNVSDRQDITGGKKLDQIVLNDLNQNEVLSWNLHYSYFDATNVISNGYDYANGTGTTLVNETRSSLRLQLLDVTQANGDAYTFTYNSTPLPKKNSFAQDYWGFYNGQLNNSSLVPDPTALNHPELGTNGNNRNANLSFCKAGILEQIKYPSQGTANFIYELNEFDRYQMSDYPTTASTIQGCGLRIKSITFNDNINSGINNTTYSYSGGKLINDIKLVRQISYITHDGTNGNNSLMYSSWTYNSISANGVFSSNPLASINGVGYSQVTKQNFDNNNNSLGSTVTQYYNNIDIHNPTIATRFISCGIPAVRDITQPENGSVQSVDIYDNLNNHLKNIVNSYTLSNSLLRYGARILPGTTLYYMTPSDYSDNYIQKNLVGYFPIFDVETMLDHSTVTDYDKNGNTAVTTSNYSYDSYNQIVLQRKTNSTYFEEYSYLYTYNDLSNSVNTALLNSNRLNEISQVQKIRREFNYYQYKYLSKYINQFTVAGNNIVIGSVSNYGKLNSDGSVIGSPETTSFDVYDPVNANLLQYTDKGIVHTLLWGYNGQHIVAEVVGANYNTVSGIITNQSLLNNPSNDNSLRTYLNNLRTSLPNSALVTTYTYSPLIGITSLTNPDNRTNYYEYDMLGRLNLVRDQDQNIIKKYDYQTQISALTPSSPVTYWNTAQSVTYTRNNCGTGYTGGSYTTNVAANTYSSNISIHDANQTAFKYIVSVGQLNANTYGTCTVSQPIVQCTTANCSGEGYKCVNGVCELGVQVYTSSVYDTLSGSYTCTYHYEWSDGTWSSDYTVIRDSECIIPV